MKSIFYSIIVLTVLGCSKNNAAYQVNNPDPRNSVEIGQNNKTLSLKDYLIRLPNLYWDQNRIMLKETSSITSQGEPLYVIDGTNVGKSYSAVEGLIDPNDIKSVRVLSSASETSFYGLNGVNGVILIKSKK